MRFYKWKAQLRGCQDVLSELSVSDGATIDNPARDHGEGESRGGGGQLPPLATPESWLRLVAWNPWPAAILTTGWSQKGPFIGTGPTKPLTPTNKSQLCSRWFR